jgi:hypothetical protein
LTDREPTSSEHIEVYVNGNLVKIFRGMEVKHALIACDYDLYRAARDGELIVEDENGFRVGLEGALTEGARILTRSGRT